MITRLEENAVNSLETGRIQNLSLWSRRRVLTGGLGLSFAVHRGIARAADPSMPEIRVASLRFGSLSWLLDVIRRHNLDRDAGFRLVELSLAGSQATQVALQAGSADLAVQDWLWAARQREQGGDWVFSPFSSESGGILVRADSRLHGIDDLKQASLGVAGGPIDKSWLIFRAFAARTLGYDPQSLAPFFAAPPLLNEQLSRGRLDAALTYWPFVARGEAHGGRVLLHIGDALAGLGLPVDTPLVGYVFRSAWANGPGQPGQRFLKAAAQAQALLATSDTEWQAIRPLTGAEDDRELILLRDAYRAGIPHHWGKAQIDAAQSLLTILHALPGAETSGLPTRIPVGLFLAEVTL
ncbi:ABC transporter ATP-binding protein [Granulibacter bethesdensis]|nr:ABC transporter ATP-binding protein [Granulibacter bethesdensis]